MATASPTPKPRPVSLWRRPLLVGVCFAVGYGLTQRLLDLRLPALVQWGQAFEVRDRPGTSLESLRLGFGSDQQDLRGRLDWQQLEPQPTPTPDPLASPGPDATAATPEPAESTSPVAPMLPPAGGPAELPASAEAPPAPRQP